MKVVAIIQARMGSTRLPNKVIKDIIGKPMIEILLTRLSQSKEVDQIVVATSREKINDSLQSLVESLGYECTRGSENDVLGRF
jgi:glutamate-1-semialdehyde 2,1-aminomutase